MRAVGARKAPNDWWPATCTTDCACLRPGQDVGGCFHRPVDAATWSETPRGPSGGAAFTRGLAGVANRAQTRAPGGIVQHPGAGLPIHRQHLAVADLERMLLRHGVDGSLGRGALAQRHLHPHVLQRVRQLAE